MTQLRDILKKGKMFSLLELKHSNNFLRIDEWRYLQLYHFTQSLPHPIRSGDELTPLERMCCTNNAKKTISKLYNLVLKVNEVEIPPYIKKWKHELGTQRDNTSIGKMLTLTHGSAVDSDISVFLF